MTHPIYGEKHIAFTFIVKDGEHYLDKNIKFIQNLGQKFEDYKIFFVENDSKDSTRCILRQYMDSDPNIIGKFYNLDGKSSLELCKKGGQYNCVSRVQRLAKIRNMVLDLVRENNYDGDYLVMLDLDFEHIPDPSKLFEKINSDEDIDAIFGMSITNKDKFYDTAAIQPYTYIKRFSIALGYNNWVSVKSAFSGFGLYRWNSIKHNKYNENTKNIEHIDFNKQLNNCLVKPNFNPLYKTTDNHPGNSRNQGRIIFWSIIGIVSVLLIYFIIVKIIL